MYKLKGSLVAPCYASMEISCLQEYFAFKYYKIYGQWPRAKHLENNRAILLYKIANMECRHAKLSITT
jgi:hypothetical protein